MGLGNRVDAMYMGSSHWLRDRAHAAEQEYLAFLLAAKDAGYTITDFRVWKTAQPPITATATLVGLVTHAQLFADNPTFASYRFAIELGGNGNHQESPREIRELIEPGPFEARKKILEWMLQDTGGLTWVEIVGGTPSGSLIRLRAGDSAQETALDPALLAKPPRYERLRAA